MCDNHPQLRRCHATRSGCHRSNEKTRDRSSCAPPCPARWGGQATQHCVHYGGAKLGQGRLGHIHSQSNDTLPAALRQPKQNGKTSPLRRNGRRRPRRSRQVRSRTSHKLVKVRRSHTHISEKSALLNALSKEATHKIPRARCTPVCLTTDISQVSQLG